MLWFFLYNLLLCSHLKLNLFPFLTMDTSHKTLCNLASCIVVPPWQSTHTRTQIIIHKSQCFTGKIDETAARFSLGRLPGERKTASTCSHPVQQNISENICRRDAQTTVVCVVLRCDGDTPAVVLH